MGFPELIGNTQLKKRVSVMVQSGKVSHCYLITGPSGSGKHTLALRFAAALQCEQTDSAPCGECLPCRKVLKGLHPDVISVDEPDKKELSVALIRDIVEDAYTLPNEGRKKIYVIEHAEKLNVRDQNALLKTLEEPPAHAVFLLLLPNAGLMLPTIRSRCPELSLSPIPAGELISALKKRYPGHTEEDYLRCADAEYLGAAAALLEDPPDDTMLRSFAEAYASHDAYALLRLFSSLEKTGKDSFRTLLLDWKLLLSGALACRYGRPMLYPEQSVILEKRSVKEILQSIAQLETAVLHCDSNVNTAAICSALAVRLST